jgi:hypothetical protein
MWHSADCHFDGILLCVIQLCGVLRMSFLCAPSLLCQLSIGCHSAGRHHSANCYSNVLNSAECHSAECCGAILKFGMMLPPKIFFLFLFFRPKKLFWKSSSCHSCQLAQMKESLLNSTAGKYWCHVNSSTHCFIDSPFCQLAQISLQLYNQ